MYDAKLNAIWQARDASEAGQKNAESIISQTERAMEHATLEMSVLRRQNTETHAMLFKLGGKTMEVPEGRWYIRDDDGDFFEHDSGHVRHTDEGAPVDTPRFKQVVERRVLPNGQTRVTFDDHSEQFLQAAVAEALRCDPKYLGTAVRISKSGKNGSICDEPKSGDLTGADADMFTVLIEGAKKNKTCTRAELIFHCATQAQCPRPRMK